MESAPVVLAGISGSGDGAAATILCPSNTYLKADGSACVTCPAGQTVWDQVRPALLLAGAAAAIFAAMLLLLAVVALLAPATLRLKVSLHGLAYRCAVFLASALATVQLLAQVARMQRPDSLPGPVQAFNAGLLLTLAEGATVPEACLLAGSAIPYRSNVAVIGASAVLTALVAAPLLIKRSWLAPFAVMAASLLYVPALSAAAAMLGCDLRVRQATAALTAALLPAATRIAVDSGDAILSLNGLQCVSKPLGYAVGVGVLALALPGLALPALQAWHYGRRRTPALRSEFMPACWWLQHVLQAQSALLVLLQLGGRYLSIAAAAVGASAMTAVAVTWLVLRPYPTDHKWKAFATAASSLVLALGCAASPAASAGASIAVFALEITLLVGLALAFVRLSLRPVSPAEAAGTYEPRELGLPDDTPPQAVAAATAAGVFGAAALAFLGGSVASTSGGDGAAGTPQSPRKGAGGRHARRSQVGSASNSSGGKDGPADSFAVAVVGQQSPRSGVSVSPAQPSPRQARRSTNAGGLSFSFDGPGGAGAGYADAGTGSPAAGALAATHNPLLRAAAAGPGGSSGSPSASADAARRRSTMKSIRVDGDAAGSGGGSHGKGSLNRHGGGAMAASFRQLVPPTGRGAAMRSRTNASRGRSITGAAGNDAALAAAAAAATGASKGQLLPVGNDGLFGGDSKAHPAAVAGSARLPRQRGGAATAAAAATSTAAAAAADQGEQRSRPSLHISLHGSGDSDGGSGSESGSASSSAAPSPMPGRNARTSSSSSASGGGAASPGGGAGASAAVGGGGGATRAARASRAGRASSSSPTGAVASAPHSPTTPRPSIVILH